MSERRPVPRSRRPLGRRQWIGGALIASSGLLLVAGAWLGVTAILARDQLNQARTEAQVLRDQISAGKWAAAQVTAANLTNHVHRAHQMTSGPVWATASAVPHGGEPLHTVRVLTASIDSLTQQSLPQLVRAGQRLDPRTPGRPNDRIDLVGVAAVRPILASATATVAKATADISRLPAHTWLGPVDTARSGVLGQLTTLDGALTSANLAAKVLPAMLGQDGPKRYFVAFQTGAEARGTGGLPGAFAIVEADHGKMRFARMESDTALAGVSADVDFGADYDHLYRGARTTTLYVNGNLSPHFPYAAQIWASMWQRRSGERVDGAIAVDPTALSYLLAATGPAPLPDGSQVSGANAVALTQSAIYAKFTGRTAAEHTQRRAYQLSIAAAASKKILGAHGASEALIKAVGKAAAERRFLVWSADPTVQTDLAATPVAGMIPITKAPYVGLVIVNGGGNKLDYYLDRSLTWQRTGCGPTRQTRVTITLTNNAPVQGLSEYVTDRSDRRSYRVKPGDNRMSVTYFATQGALMEAVNMDGQPSTASIGSERGHPVYTVDLEVPRGTSRSVVLQLTEPEAKGKPIVLRQPLVRPLHVTLNDVHCP